MAAAGCHGTPRNGAKKKNNKSHQQTFINICSLFVSAAALGDEDLGDDDDHERA